MSFARAFPPRQRPSHEVATRSVPFLRLSVLFAVLPWPTAMLTSFTSSGCCSAISSAMPNAAAAIVTADLQSGKDLPTSTALQPASSNSAVRRPGIAFGDRLKVTFLETVSVPVGHGSSRSDNVVATIFPRADLSADLIVDEEGSVAVPKLGQFSAVGHTVPELQVTLTEAFKRSFGRPCDVEVAISERQPIYVLGDVRAPGVFRYSPGMIVMQALAQAGGSERPSVDSSRAIENARETERLRKQENVLSRLLIKQARLAAQRENLPNLILPPTIRAQVSQSPTANALTGLIESAAMSLASDRARAHMERTLAERQITIAQNDAKAHAKRLTQLQDVLVKKQQRLADLKGLASRGSVPQYNVLTMEIDLSDSMVRVDDEAIVLAQAERRVMEAEAALERLVSDAAAQLEADWTATMQEIAESNQAIETMTAVIRITSGSGDEPRPLNQADVVITRRTAEGLSTMPATESTRLQPGDVVRVGRGSPAAAPDMRNADGARRSIL